MKNANDKNLISPISKLSVFISKYPNQGLHDQLKLLEESFPTYRAVKGDGNCFYRAFAFLYLSHKICEEFIQTFPITTWICRATNKTQKQFQHCLQSVWLRYLLPLSKVESLKQRQNKLQNIFNNMADFDQTIIGYFRSVTYKYMQSHKDQLIHFFNNQQHFYKHLQNVSTFKAQSQQIQIQSLCQAMKFRLIVLNVQENALVPINYGSIYKESNVYLFYRPGHYDIIYPMVPQQVSSSLYRLQQINMRHLQNSQLKHKNQNSHISTSQIIANKPQKNDGVLKKQQGGNIKRTESKTKQSQLRKRGEFQKPAQLIKRSSLQHHFVWQNETNFDLRNNQKSQIDSSGQGHNKSVLNKNRNKQKGKKSSIEKNVKVVKSQNQIFERISKQVLAIGALGISSYFIYHYFY